MLKFMGFPCIEAPCEAEAQCVWMVKQGFADAVASEDYDCLTFGAKIMLAGFKNKKEPVKELVLDQVLEGLNLSMEQFIDMCILCGCDYTSTIRGFGPAKILNYIQEHKTIENVIEQLKLENSTYKNKEGVACDKWIFPAPSDFQFEEARELFVNPCVDKEVTKEMCKSGPADEEKLRELLVEQKGFAEYRVTQTMDKIKNNASKGQQTSLESFFGKPVTVNKAPVKPGKGGKNAAKSQPGKKKKFTNQTWNIPMEMNIWKELNLAVL